MSEGLLSSADEKIMSSQMSCESEEGFEYHSNDINTSVTFSKKRKRTFSPLKGNFSSNNSGD